MVANLEVVSLCLFGRVALIGFDSKYRVAVSVEACHRSVTNVQKAICGGSEEIRRRGGVMVSASSVGWRENGSRALYLIFDSGGGLGVGGVKGERLRRNFRAGRLGRSVLRPSMFVLAVSYLDGCWFPAILILQFVETRDADGECEVDWG